MVSAFRQGLKETGYVEGQNVAIEYRWAEGQYDRLPALAADLVRRQVAVIVAAGGTPAGIWRQRRRPATIPIVFAMAPIRCEVGLVASFNRPGGNLTGVTSLNVEVGPKRLELASRVGPHGDHHCAARQPDQSHSCRTLVARPAGGGPHHSGCSSMSCMRAPKRDFETAFATLVPNAGRRARDRRRCILHRAERTTRRTGSCVTRCLRSTSIASSWRPAVWMGYGGSIADSYRLAGVYAGRILKGEKPADLPVMQATKVELIINLKTAKALGITVPLTLLGRADEVIE